MTASRGVKIAITVVTMVLLTGMGGEAIVAAPALVPALWWAARSSGAWARPGLTVLAALVMTEVGWFLAYTAGGEARPSIVLGPALGAALTITIFFFTLRSRSEKIGSGARGQERSTPRAQD